MHNQYHPILAVKEHLLEGNRISYLEASLIFGLQNLTATITTFRREGFIVKKQKVLMTKALRRINEVMICRPPAELPIREVKVTEYWFSI